jgi:Protein of unknown function (DUF3485)
VHRTMAIVVVLVTLVLSGTVSGSWNQRWASTTNLGVFANATLLPVVAGDWDGREKPVNPAEIQMAQAAAMVQKQYVNRRTGQVASVLLVIGRPGPISVHTPEVCYAGNGYDRDGVAARFSVSADKGDQFWKLRLKKRAAVPVLLSVYYAWNDGGAWQAADNPRVMFAGRPALFKLYVVRERTSDNETETDDSTSDLLRALLPLIHSSMSPAG